MDFSFSEDQVAIRDLAHQIFTDRASDEFLLEFSRTDKTYDEELWQTLAEQGLLGLSAPESAGGSELGFTELCLMLEEQGRRVAPVPLLGNLVMAGLPLARFGSDEQQQRWLKPMVEGSIKLATAITEQVIPGANADGVIAIEQADGWQLKGSKSCIIDGACADAVIVPARISDTQQAFFIVDVQSAGVNLSDQEVGLSGNCNATMQLDGVAVTPANMLGSADDFEQMLQYIEQHTQVAQCAMRAGICEEAMRRTAAYTSERKQFGVPIGSFQALAMRMADSYIDVEAMRSTCWQAMWRLTEGLSAEAEVRIAKWWACEGSHRIVHTAQHLHAGMGADVEYPIHRFFLWAKQHSYNFGSSSQQLDALGKLLAKNDDIGYTAIEV